MGEGGGGRRGGRSKVYTLVLTCSLQVCIQMVAWQQRLWQVCQVLLQHRGKVMRLVVSVDND